MLKREYRAAHAPEVWTLTHALTQASRTQNKFSLRDQARLLKNRDALLNLEFESNWIFGLLIRPLYEAFPNAKYILTIRDCFSWINSEINQQHIYGHIQPWNVLADFRYGAMRVFDHREQGLRKLDLYPVSRYFSYWSNHIRLVLDTIPEQQLLVLRTRDLSHEARTIADFLNLDESNLDMQRSHSHRRKDKPLSIEELVDPNYLHYQAKIYCQDIMRKFYDGL